MNIKSWANLKAKAVLSQTSLLTIFGGPTGSDKGAPTVIVRNDAGELTEVFVQELMDCKTVIRDLAIEDILEKLFENGSINLNGKLYTTQMMVEQFIKDNVLDEHYVRDHCKDFSGLLTEAFNELEQTEEGVEFNLSRPISAPLVTP